MNRALIKDALQMDLTYLSCITDLIHLSNPSRQQSLDLYRFPSAAFLLSAPKSEASSFEYLEVFHNRQRLYSVTGYLRSADFEQLTIPRLYDLGYIKHFEGVIEWSVEVELGNG